MLAEEIPEGDKTDKGGGGGLSFHSISPVVNDVQQHWHIHLEATTRPH